MNEISQLLVKAIYFAQIDSYYILPLIGSIQIFFTGIFFKKKTLIYLSIFLLTIFSFLFPLVKLIPNLGSDAFSEFQKLNFDEVYFYIKTLNFFAGWSIKNFILWFLLIFSYVVFVLIIFILSKKLSFINFLNINYVIIFCLIVIPSFLNFYKVSLLYSSSILEKKNQLQNIDYELKDIKIDITEPTDLSVIFYIGEATSRLHWSLYNYFRPTNLSLEKFYHENPFIVYDNIYSTHTHTSPSLLDALTIKKSNENNKAIRISSDYSRYTITDILNNIYINTSLYSTQAKSGSWNFASSLIFKNANKLLYSSKYNLGNANYINEEKPFDHEFLNIFLRDISNDINKDNKKNNFYVFHSYAGHGDYEKNIPKAYHKNLDQFYVKQSDKAIFGRNFKNNQKQFLENYDSAMKYISDNILLTLNKISKLNKPIIFIYTSDHGESPLTGRAHDSSRYIWEMSSVPFIIYFNEKAKLKYPDLYNRINQRSLKKNRDLLSNFPSLIFEIFNITIFDKNLDLDKSSKCKFGGENCLEDYHIIRNQLNTLGVVNLKYPIKEQNDFIDNTDRATTFSNMKNYLSNKGSNLEICSHRTNSIARFIRFNAILNCMEIDIIIEEDYFDVRHSTEKSTYLKLKDLIKIQKEKQNFLWLDIKKIENLDQCNKLSINLDKNLNQFDNAFFLIEFPSEVIHKINEFNSCISSIKEKNYKTSYYVPNNIKTKCLEELESNISNNGGCSYVDKITEKIYESKLFTDLSFDYNNYDYIKNSKYIDKFLLNTWYIPDSEIASINDQNFRLIIPYNDNVNYN